MGNRPLDTDRYGSTATGNAARTTFGRGSRPASKSKKKSRSPFDETAGAIADIGDDVVDMSVRFGKIGKPLEEFYSRYLLMATVLGKGSFAEVRLAKDLWQNIEVAVKIMIKANMEQSDIEDMRREVAIVSNLDHDNIVKIFEFYEDDQLAYIVMEYVSGGELYRTVTDISDYTEKDTRDIMLTLVDALEHCRKHRVVHRDIKPDNILLRKRLEKKGDRNKAMKLAKKWHPMQAQFVANMIDEKQRGYDENGFVLPEPFEQTSFRVAKKKYEIVLVDFGFAKQTGRDQVQSLQTQCGTPMFLAPEIIDERPYSYKVDVWSLGVVCFMLLSGGQMPFPAKTANELFAKVRKCQYEFVPLEAWAEVSDSGKDFVRSLLQVDPAKRPSYEDMLKHRWFHDREVTSGAANKDKTVDFEAMRRFNARRKVLRAFRAKQAAVNFKKLMKTLERRSKAQNGASLKKYLDLRISEIAGNPLLQMQLLHEGAPPVDEEPESLGRTNTEPLATKALAKRATNRAAQIEAHLAPSSSSDDEHFGIKATGTVTSTLKKQANLNSLIAKPPPPNVMSKEKAKEQSFKRFGLGLSEVELKRKLQEDQDLFEEVEDIWAEEQKNVRDDDNES